MIGPLTEAIAGRRTVRERPKPALATKVANAMGEAPNQRGLLSYSPLPRGGLTATYRPGQAPPSQRPRPGRRQAHHGDRVAARVAGHRNLGAVD